MKDYFVDYEIYSNGSIAQWGNFFTTASSIDIVELADEIKEKIIEEHKLNIAWGDIRFRQFNAI